MIKFMKKEKKKMASLLFAILTIVIIIASMLITINSANTINNYLELFGSTGIQAHWEMAQYEKNHLFAKLSLVTFIAVLVGEIIVNLMLQQKYRKKNIVFMIISLIVFIIYLAVQLFNPLIFLGIHQFIYSTICLIIVILNFIRYIVLDSMELNI